MTVPNFTISLAYLQRQQSLFATTGAIGFVNETGFDNSYLYMNQTRSYGANLKDWKERIRLGQNATTFAQGSQPRHLKHGFYYWGHKWRVPSPDPIGAPQLAYTSSSTMSGSYVGSLSTPPSIADSAADDAAKAAFVRNARKHQTSALGGEILKDFGKTIHSVKGIGRGILKSFFGHARSMEASRKQFLIDTRKGSGSLAALNRKVDELSSKYLEWNYGIQPSISDFNGVIQGLERGLVQKNFALDRARVFGFGENSSRSVSSFQFGVTTPHEDGARIIATATVEKRYLVKYYGSVATLVSDYTSKNIAGQLGFGLRDFIPTIWECVPYSFVIDYFTNAGQIISALSFPRSDVRWISRLVRNEHTTSVQYSRRNALPPQNGIEALDEFQYEPDVYKQTVWTRDIYTGDLVPSFRLHLPYRATDWVGMLSLLTNAFNRSSLVTRQIYDKVGRWR